MLERLQEMVEVAGGQTKVSGITGAEPRTVYRWLKGESAPKFEHLAAVAKAAGVSLEWLATGEGPKFNADKPLQSNGAQLTGHFVGVPRYNAAASAGHGSFIHNAEILDRIPFTEDFLRKRLNRSSADGLILVDARGDSMEPTISDNDLIMIDMKQNGSNLTSAIYAFTYEDNFFVKRLNIMSDSLEVISDNKEYGPFIIGRENMERTNILGRVVWIGHTP